MTRAPVIAVDIGGTKVAVAVVTPEREVHARMTEPMDQSGPAGGIAQIIRLCRAAAARADVAGIGVGIPAVLAPETDHIIWAPNIHGWRGVALRPALEAAFGLPACIEYDGHTAALGEWWVLPSPERERETLVSVIIGTGIGGGIIAEGRLLRGRNRLAGASGWFALTTDPSGSQERAQGIGHWESLAAGPGIARRARALLNDYPGSTLARIGETLSARDVFEAARAGDRCAQRIVEETADLIGLGVSSIVSLLNPDRIVLGGSIGCQGDVLLPRVREVAARWAQPASGAAVHIDSSRLGGDAGLLGAAYAAFSRLTQNV